MRSTYQNDISSTLEPVIESLSNNKESVAPTAEQQELLATTKASLLEKMKTGKQFHSVELRSFTEVVHDRVKMPALRTTRTPDPEPLLARGVMVNKLTSNELTLAKEVFGIVVESSDGIFLPVDLSKKDKAELVLENVSLKFSNAFNDNSLIRKNIKFGIASGGTIAAINKIGLKATFANIAAKFVGGTMVAPGFLTVLGGGAVAGAAIGAAFAVSPLAEKIKTVRQAAKDKKDGDEMEIAMNAVSKIDYPTIISTERSNLLPTLAPEVDQKISDTNRKFEKKNKPR